MIFTAILFLTVFTFETSAEGTIQDLNARIKSLESLIAVHENAIVGLDKQVGEHDTKIGEFDTEITNLQDATTKVFFSVAKTSGYWFTGDITYDQQIFSPDGAFELDQRQYIDNGMVTFNIAGVYQFTFSGQSGLGRHEATSISVKKMAYNPIVQLETWTADELWADTEANSITFEACEDCDICCMHMLDKDMEKGAKDTFTMSENFKKCLKDPRKKNYFMSTTNSNGWKAKEIKIHYSDQTSVECTLNGFLKARSGGEQRLPLSCNPVTPTKPVFKIFDSNAAEGGDGNNLSYVWIMEIEQGDTIGLHSENYLYAGPDNSNEGSDYQLTFTGQLIQKQ